MNQFSLQSDANLKKGVKRENRILSGRPVQTNPFSQAVQTSTASLENVTSDKNIERIASVDSFDSQRPTVCHGMTPHDSAKMLNIGEELH